MREEVCISAPGAAAGCGHLGVGRVCVAGPAPPQQSPAGRRALPGSGCAAGAAREEAFPALCFHCLHGGTSSRTVFSRLFQLSSIKAMNTRGRNWRVKLRPALGPAAPKPRRGAGSAWEGMSKGAGVSALPALPTLPSPRSTRSRGVLFPGQAPLALSVNW